MTTILNNKYKELDLYYDSNRKALWILLKPKDTPVLTLNLLRNLRKLQNDLADLLHSNNSDKPKFIILASQTKKIFNLGMDLNYLSYLIRNQNELEIREYLDYYIETIYLNLINLNHPIISISYISGKTYGAGLELALSSDITLANNDASFGFPAIKLGFMINTGGYNIISERLPCFSESPLFHGDILNGHSMEKLGLVKDLVANGNSLNAINNHIDSMSKRYQKSVIEYRSIKQKILPVFKQNFKLYSEYTLNCLLNIRYTNLNSIQRIINIQKKMCSYNNLKETLNNL